MFFPFFHTAVLLAPNLRHGNTFLHIFIRNFFIRPVWIVFFKAIDMIPLPMQFFPSQRDQPFRFINIVCGIPVIDYLKPARVKLFQLFKLRRRHKMHLKRHSLFVEKFRENVYGLLQIPLSQRTADRQSVLFRKKNKHVFHHRIMYIVKRSPQKIIRIRKFTVSYRFHIIIMLYNPLIFYS